MREHRVTDLGHVFPLLVDCVVELMTLKVASCIHDRVFEVAGGFSTWRTFFFFCAWCQSLLQDRWFCLRHFVFFVLFWSLIKRRSRDELDNGALPPAQMMKSARSHPANEIKSRTCSAVVEREMWRVNQNTGYLTTCLRVLVIIIVEYTTLTRQHPLLRLFIVFSTLAQGLCTCLWLCRALFLGSS